MLPPGERAKNARGTSPPSLLSRFTQHYLVAMATSLDKSSVLGNSRYYGAHLRIYLGTCRPIRRKSTYTSAFVVLPFRNAMEHWNADGRINSGNNQAITWYKFGGFLISISRVHAITVYTLHRRQSALGLVYLRWLGGSTVMFRYYLLGGDTAVPSWLYARLCHAFLVVIFVMLFKFLRPFTSIAYIASLKRAACICLNFSAVP